MSVGNVSSTKYTECLPPQLISGNYCFSLLELDGVFGESYVKLVFLLPQFCLSKHYEIVCVNTRQVKCIV